MTGRDYLALANAYEAGVLAGEIDACKWVRLACARNAHDFARQGAEDFPYRFDGAAAVRVCMTAERLPHVKGPKAKVIGQDDEGRSLWACIELEPWQCWFLTRLFGWVQVSDGLRRFRVAFLVVPRKNAKSTIAAAVVLYMLALDGESGGENYSAATTRDQAKVVAEIAWEMAKRSPLFREYFGVKLGAKTHLTLTVPETASKFSPLSADAHTLDALNVSLAIIDELHAHRTRDVWDVLDTATGARPQPLILATTTAGVDTGGICYEKLSYLRKVLDGTFADEAVFGVEYTVDDGDDWRDPATHRKANPNYGVSVNASDLARKVQEAEQSPAAVHNFLTKHLNVWVRSESTWMPMDAFRACGDPSLTLEALVGAPCWIGVDLAEVRDIAALIALFRPSPDEYVAVGKFYLPEETVHKSPIAQLSGWARTGALIQTEGNQADYQRIEDDIMALCDVHDVREVDFDRALASQMAQNLKRRLASDMGKDTAEQFVVTVPQTVPVLNPAMQSILGLVLSKKFRHDANPCGAWMWSNVVVELNHKGEIYPRKAGGKDSPNKIDAAVATLIAFSRASQAEIGPKRRRRGAKMWTPMGFVDAAPPAPPPPGGTDART